MMNELTVPPSPNWYSNSVFVCTSDNTIIYGSRKDIVIINPNDKSGVEHIKIIYSAHNDRITSVSPNNGTWNSPEKLLASVAEDQIVKLWDLKTYTFKDSHKGHENKSDPLVGVSLAGDRVISVSENFIIAVWRISTNDLVVLPNMLNGKCKVKSLATCPHATWLTAFGLNNGLVILVDLRRRGKIIYRLRGNECDITSIAWCPAPYNIFDSYISKKICMTRKPFADDSNFSEADFMKRVNSDELCEIDLHNGHAKDSAEKVLDVSPNTSSDMLCPTIATLNDTPSSCNTDDSANIEPSNLIIDKADEPANINTDLTNDTIIEEHSDIPNVIEITKEVLDNQPLENNVIEQFSEIKIELPTDVVNDIKMADSVLTETILEPNTCDTIREIETQVSLVNTEDNEISDTLRTNVDECMCAKEELLNSDMPKCMDTTEAVESLKTSVEVSGDFLNDTTQKANDASSVVHLTDVKTEEATNLVTPNANQDTDIQDMLTNDQVGNAPESKDEDVLVPEKRFISEEPSTEYLLATACKSGIICIWRAGTDGRLQLTLPPPTSNQKSSNRSNKQNDKRNRWISLCWVEPDVLVSSSTRNDVYAWNLVQDIDAKKKSKKNALYSPRYIHADHKRNIFVITSPYYLYSYDEMFTTYKNDEDVTIWSMSQDRWILCSEIGKRRELHASISTMGGYVMHLAASSLDPSRVAIGIGDSSIRVWELSSCQAHSIKMSCLSDKIKSRVTYLDWHPVKDNCLGFATSEGQLGEFDLNLKSKAPVIYNNYHREQIYRIQWGPLPEQKDVINGLYSCSKGEFTIHDSSKPTREPFHILLPDCRVQTFAWKTDFSILAVGTKEGHVKLLSKDLVPFQTLYMQNKSVQCVAWHPLSTVADSGVSIYENDLAVATNDPIILVYRCVEQKESETMVIATLKGHATSVKALSWCPHITGRLVSIAEDSSAMVWNVHTQTLLSTFIGHGIGKQSVNCVLWSPLDADLILTGGKDCTIRIWRVTKNPPIPFDLVTYVEDRKKKRSPKNGIQESVADTETVSLLTQEKKQATFYALPTISRLQNPDAGYTIPTCRKLLEQLESATNNDNVSPVEHDQSSSVASNVVDEIRLTNDKDSVLNEDNASSMENDKNSGKSSNSIDATQIFGSRSDIISLLNYEQNTHMAKKRWEMSHNLAMWKGDLVQSIEQAVKSGIINPWIISMAPMVSHKLWSQLCSIYAEKLTEDGDGMLASSYFLACHKVHNAIDALCKSNLYREAISLAKCRLPDDAIINSLLEKWAAYAINIGNYDIAAQCFITLNKLSEAGEMLNKRLDKESLEMAAELAERSNNSDLLNTVRIKLDTLKPLESDIDMDIPENSGINIFQSRFDALINRCNIEESTESENEDCANDTNI